MNDEDKKLLTEFLGECWHELRLITPELARCSKCTVVIDVDISSPQKWVMCNGEYNRSFTTWQDMGDLKEKLVGKGMWTNFYLYAKTKCWIDEYFCESNVVAWFLNPAVFIPLVVEFLRKEKV